MQGGVLVVDLEGKTRVIHRSACSMLGHRESELLGKPISMLAGSLNGDRLNACRSMQNQAVHDMEMTWQTRDGRQIDISVAASQIGSERHPTRRE